jgi:hypothetical protein
VLINKNLVNNINNKSGLTKKIIKEKRKTKLKEGKRLLIYNNYNYA